ncbi:spermidine synthase-like [Rhopilema esculentum]|uniref:spermidine synthase-like n=1 Tax=Rhopilema esculentum TaxID=499914 RepID=UPI0031DF38AF|eukprot:gene7241-12923_t
MDRIRDGWFYEKSDTFPGQSFGLEIEKVLYHDKSKYQDILVFQSKSYGTVLVLDGIIQCSSRDEFSYQEMIANIPLNCHPDPKKVLIIGGGDGGVAREVAKHPAVEAIDLCEIDEMVIDVSKKFIKEMSSGFNSHKVTVHICDGFKFLENHLSQYDVIIADISDPEGKNVVSDSIDLFLAVDIMQVVYYAFRIACM